jgi:hypothetical protein
LSWCRAGWHEAALHNRPCLCRAWFSSFFGVVTG